MYEIFVELLKKHNVTAAQVAKETGISQSTLSEWKHGNYRPKADKMQKIANYFGVSVSYLIGENDNKTLINDVQFNNDSHPNENILRIAGRDGRQIEKRLTDEQVKALEAIINQLPDAPDDL